MVHGMGAPGHMSGGDLSQRTLPLFFSIIRQLLAEGVTVVAEAAFQDQLWRPNLEALATLGRLRMTERMSLASS